MSQSVKVFSDKDRVVLDFPSRGQTLQLGPDAARKLVEAMREAHKDCKTWVESGGTCHLIRGEPKGVKIQSWDGFVNVRFESPTERELIPFEIAEKMADMIESKIPEAEERITILWGGR